MGVCVYGSVVLRQILFKSTFKFDNFIIIEIDLIFVAPVIATVWVFHFSRTATSLELK